jgi:hypothetical protein
MMHTRFNICPTRGRPSFDQAYFDQAYFDQVWAA